MCWAPGTWFSAHDGCGGSCLSVIPSRDVSAATQGAPGSPATGSLDLGSQSLERLLRAGLRSLHVLTHPLKNYDTYLTDGETESQRA